MRSLFCMPEHLPKFFGIPGRVSFTIIMGGTLSIGFVSFSIAEACESRTKIISLIT